MLLDPHGVIAAAVETASADRPRKSRTRGNATVTSRSINSYMRCLAQCDLGANRHAVTQFVGRNRITRLGDDRLLSGNLLPDSSAATIGSAWNRRRRRQRPYSRTTFSSFGTCMRIAVAELLPVICCTQQRRHSASSSSRIPYGLSHRSPLRRALGVTRTLRPSFEHLVANPGRLVVFRDLQERQVRNMCIGSSLLTMPPVC